MKNNKYIYIDADDDLNDNTQQSKFKIPKSSKIDYLIDEAKYDEALDLIEKTLKKDEFDYWNYKAIVLDNLNEYEKSVDCFTKALTLNPADEVKLNKSETLYKWAKITYFPELEYEKALKLINDAIDIIPENNDASEYYFLKGEILEALREYVEARKSYLIAYKEFDKLNELEKQIEYITSTTDVLINITGTNHYNFTPMKDLIVELIREEDNEHDPNAIAVYLDNEKIGYVANSPYTLFEGVKSATQIKNLEFEKAQILFVYLDEYIVAKII